MLGMKSWSFASWLIVFKMFTEFHNHIQNVWGGKTKIFFRTSSGWRHCLFKYHYISLYILTIYTQYISLYTEHPEPSHTITKWFPHVNLFPFTSLWRPKVGTISFLGGGTCQLSLASILRRINYLQKVRYYFKVCKIIILFVS